MSLKRIFPSERFFHIYNRGNRKDPIYKEDFDYQYFIQLLNEGMQKFPLCLPLFCLMPNHFHFIAVSLRGKKTFPRFMQYVTTHYAIYFNRKYDTVGHLLQGRYQAKIVRSRIGLEFLFQYIVLNPQQAKLVTTENLLNYSWSNAAIYSVPSLSVIPPLVIKETDYNIQILGLKFPLWYPKTHWRWVEKLQQRIVRP